MLKLIVNGKTHEVYLPEDTPLLWVLREELRLTGTKFGCGIGICGACTVHVGGQAVRSCLMMAGQVKEEITTIEGLTPDHPVKKAWSELAVPQCGYCQPGQIMAAAALLKKNPRPSRKEILEAMAQNLCRCGTYPRIIAAIEKAVGGAA